MDKEIVKIPTGFDQFLALSSFSKLRDFIPSLAPSNPVISGGKFQVQYSVGQASLGYSVCPPHYVVLHKSNRSSDLCKTGYLQFNATS